VAGIINGLFSGRAGIESHGAGIAVIADNISNANTTSYKSARPEFTDLLAGNLGGSGGTTIGSGSQLSGVTEIFSQGTFEFTGRGLDLAIDGNGFFVLDDNGSRSYSRAGNFQIDASGNLLNQNGLKVLGFPSSGAGGLEEINVNTVTQSNVATTEIELTGNLNAAAAVTTVPTNPASFSVLSTNASFSTFVDVFDSLGASHSISVYFFKTGSGSFTAQAFADGADISGGTAGVPVKLGSDATLTFGSGGIRTTVGSPDITATPVPGWANGSSSSGIAITFDPFTQFASPSNITSISQDGRGGGNVVSFSVEGNGELFAQLDNGQTTVIGTLAMATFSNTEGLRRTGNSLYVETTSSGEPVTGTPNVGQFGGIQSGALELSTSDIAGDFIKLISLQRGFQGSSRIITSINDLLNEIINLAR
jgi:flagellar hook protein FlgE